MIFNTEPRIFKSSFVKTYGRNMGQMKSSVSQLRLIFPEKLSTFESLIFATKKIEGIGKWR